MSAPISPAPRKLPPEERRCTEKGKDGDRCKSYAVRGEKLCAGHSGRGVAASKEAAVAAQKLSASKRHERAKRARRSASEVFRAAVEEKAEEFVRIRLGIARDVTVSAADRLKAMEQLEARALGRPVQPTEDLTPTVPGSYADLATLSHDERRAMLRVLAQRREEREKAATL